MATMFTWIWIFEIVFHGVVAHVFVPPGTRWGQNVTSCEEFEQGAHFEPTEVIDAMWKIFYSWANSTELSLIVFSLLTTERMRRIKSVVESIDPGWGVPWLDADMIMEPRAGMQIVLLRLGTPGAYRALIIKEQRDKALYHVSQNSTISLHQKMDLLMTTRGKKIDRPYPPPILNMAEIRMKLVGRVMGMMSCEQLTAYALARQHEMPVTEADCAVRANKLGYRGPGGMSYLQVHRMINHEL